MLNFRTEVLKSLFTNANYKMKVFNVFRKRTSTCFLLIFLSLQFSSCKPVKNIEYRDFRNLKLEKAGFVNSTLTVDLIYYNPNNIGLELNNTDFNIYINNILLGHSAQTMQIKVPRRSEFILPLVINIDMKNLLKNGIAALFNKEVAIRAVGTVKAGKAGVFKIIPVDFTTNQKLSPF